MAWFRRKRDDESADVDAEVPIGAPAAAPDDGDVIRAETRSRAGDWMALPPIHTTVGPPPSTFKVQRVSEIMTTRRPMAFMGQLGHHVSSSAPSGHVEGLTTTVAPPTDAPHPIELPLHGRAPQHEPVAADEPPVQRSVRDLAPGEPVTAQTLGLASAAMPVVQRELAATPPSAPPAAARPSLPEPAPTRVLREPTRPPTPLETRVPSVPVVDAGDAAVSTPSSPQIPSGTIDDNGFLVPDEPVEVTMRAAVREPEIAPLSGDAPLQRSATGEAPPLEGRADAEPPSVELPLAAPASVPAGAEMMPPIQPQAVQRQAQEASTRQVQRDSETPTDNGLPPLPSWARRAVGSADLDSSDDAVAASAAAPTPPPMPLHAPTPAATVQRESAASGADADVASQPDADTNEHLEGDGHDHSAHAGIGAAVQREDPETGAVAAAADVQREAATASAPLVGATPLGSVAAAGDTEDEDAAGGAPALDLPLQLPSGGATGTGPDRPEAAPVPAQALAADATLPDSAPAAGTEQEPDEVAPLLGDRPLALQRVAFDSTSPGAGGHGSHPAAPINPMSLPLAADTVSGPSLDAGPSATERPSVALTGTSPVPAARPLAFAAHATAPIQRTITAAGPGAPPAAAASPGAPLQPAQVPASSPGLPLRTLAASPATAATATGALGGGGPTAGESTIATIAPLFSPVSTSPAPDTAVQTMRETSAPMPLQEPARPEPQPNLGELAVAAGVAQRMSDGSVVFATGAPASVGSTSMPVQRSAAGSSNGFIEPPAPTTFAVQRELSSQDAAAATSTGAVDEDKRNDELADEIYSRIRWKLQADLRADRWRVNGGTWTKKGR